MNFNMKNIIKSFAAVVLLVLTVTACNTDNIKETYSPVCVSEVSFSQSVINATEIPAAENEWNVLLVRNTTASAITVSVKATLPNGITCPASVTFDAGVASTSLTLNISGMSVGKSYKGTIEIADETAMNKNIAIAKTSFTLAKAYTWVSLGKGYFYDGFWESFIGECEYQKADGFDRWRVIDPYKESEKSDGNNPAYIEMWKTEAGPVAWNTFRTGFDYSGDGDYIKGYFPSELSSSYAEKEKYSKFYEKDIVVLYPCWYIDGLGGWASSYYPIAFSFPGRSVDSFIEWITNNL